MLPPSPLDARRAFLEALIDDAGMFPPASLPLERAAANHRASKAGPHGWMLSRFICPASRLQELAKALPDSLATDDSWSVSALLDGNGGEQRWDESVARDADAARRFADVAGDRARISLVEGRIPADPGRGWKQVLAAVRRAVDASGLPGPVRPFLEVPASSPDLAAVLDALAEEQEATEVCGAFGAKVRCGGAAADSVPEPAHLAAFVAGCRDRGVAFKATAGLHHPFRHVDPETGQVQHGFVNLVGAAALSLAHHLPAGELEAILDDRAPASFALGADAFRWRDLAATPEDVAAARAGLLVSYGSCSFSEPVEDLEALGILPLAA